MDYGSNGSVTVPLGGQNAASHEDGTKLPHSSQNSGKAAFKSLLKHTCTAVGVRGTMWGTYMYCCRSEGNHEALRGTYMYCCRREGNHVANIEHVGAMAILTLQNSWHMFSQT